MIQIKKTILTLVALLAVTTGAWAKTDPNAVYWTNETWAGWAENVTTHTVGDITITCSGNAKAYESTMSGEPLALQAGANDAITFTSNGKPFKSIKIQIDDNSDPGIAGWTWVGSWTIEWSGTPSTSVTLSGCDIVADVIEFTFASAASGPEVAWNKATKTGKFTMPGGNVTLEPEYYPQAALTAAPTAINDVPATTDGAIVKAGTVANIGSTETAQGTVMYYVSPTALEDAALLALAADQWTADVPTAAHLAEGKAYVYYYVRGNDSDTDEENFSDGDILAANALTVTIAAEPTYAVTFAEGTAEPTKWSASPNADVKKGTPVTVTYTGTKKVLGVKAEKKAAAAGIVNPVVGQVIGSDGKNYDANATLPDGVEKVAMIAYVSGSNGLALALTDEDAMTWDNSAPSNKGKTAPELCSALNTSKAVTGGTWKLPSKDEWQQMFSANGGNEGSYSGLNTAIGNAGGTALLESEEYWSSSEVYDDAWRVYLDDGNAYWDLYGKHYQRCVRACLAF